MLVFDGFLFDAQVFERMVPAVLLKISFEQITQYLGPYFGAIQIQIL